MGTHNRTPGSISRRQFLTATAGVAAASLSGLKLASAADSSAPTSATSLSGWKRNHNILFVFTDQERSIPQWPENMSLPGHERLLRTGVTFRNH